MLVTKHLQKLRLSTVYTQQTGTNIINQYQPNIYPISRSISSKWQYSKIVKGSEYPCNLYFSHNAIKFREYSKLPSKEKVERVTYRAIAKSVDFVKAVRSSDGYHELKRNIWNIYLWSIQTFKKYVVENPKIKFYIEHFKRKVESAREENRRDR